MKTTVNPPAWTIKIPPTSNSAPTPMTLPPPHCELRRHRRHFVPARLHRISYHDLYSLFTPSNDPNVETSQIVACALECPRLLCDCVPESDC